MKIINAFLAIALLTYLTASYVYADVKLTKEDCLNGDVFHKLAADGNTDLILGCIEAGVPVDAVEGNGWTALHAAAFNGRIGVTELLLSAGAATDIKDKNSKTALDLAKLKKHSDVVETLNEVKQAATENGLSLDSEKAVKLAEALRWELNNYGPASSNDEIDYQVIEILNIDKSGTAPDIVYTIIVNFKTGLPNEGDDLISYKGVITEDANGRLSVTENESL